MFPCELRREEFENNTFLKEENIKIGKTRIFCNKRRI